VTTRPRLGYRETFEDALRRLSYERMVPREASPEGLLPRVGRSVATRATHRAQGPGSQTPAPPPEGASSSCSACSLARGREYWEPRPVRCGAEDLETRAGRAPPPAGASSALFFQACRPPISGAAWWRDAASEKLGLSQVGRASMDEPTRLHLTSFGWGCLGVATYIAWAISAIFDSAPPVAFILMPLFVCLWIGALIALDRWVNPRTD